MATIQLTVTEQEKRQADELFKKIGTTTSGALKMFLSQALQEQGFPFTPHVKQSKINPYAIEAEVDENGTIILPDTISERMKDWVENG
jgi:DNA-damage-inducible protein J